MFIPEQTIEKVVVVNPSSVFKISILYEFITVISFLFANVQILIHVQQVSQLINFALPVLFLLISPFEIINNYYITTYYVLV